jgi:hypothetical protein
MNNLWITIKTHLLANQQLWNIMVSWFAAPLATDKSEEPLSTHSVFITYSCC